MGSSTLAHNHDARPPSLAARVRVVLRGMDGLDFNDDWETPRSNLRPLLARHHPAFWGSQESVGEDYPATLHDLRRDTDGAVDYGVRQRRRSEASQGVAVGWDSRLLMPVGGGEDEPDRPGGGWQPLVDGADLRVRGVVWQDVSLNHQVLRALEGVGRAHRVLRVRRVASAHRPPLRDKHLWPDFDERLRHWAAQSPVPLTIFMDSNQDGGPDPLKGVSLRVGTLRWYGHRIDGAVSTVPFTRVRDLSKGSSDHRPLLMRSTR